MKRLMTPVGVAVLFALCGALSSQFLDENGQHGFLLLVPVPFALLFAALFLRTATEIVAAPLFVVAWFAAYLTATYTGIAASSELFRMPMCVGGLVGGLGVTLSATFYRRKLLSVRYLIGGCIVGSVAALPFSTWLYWVYYSNAGNDPSQRVRLRYSFAIWQAAIATYLYLCTRAKRAPLQDSR